MDFREGDQVMHWTHGLGKVVRVEEREASGPKTLYYAVEIRDLTVWVPADAKLSERLRPPTTKSGFQTLLRILGGAEETLPDDRYERRNRLLKQLRDGRAESLCRVIRDLSAYRRKKALNDNDQALLKQSQAALISEWGFALSITPAQAEDELHRILATGPAGK